jgi:hypothetical protein
MNFDFKKFQAILIKECKSSFSKIISDLSHENIYSLALYNASGELSELYPTVSTQVGLGEVVKKYKMIKYYKNTSVKKLETDLKWSICDSPRLENYVGTLPNSEKMLKKAQKILNTYFENEDDVKYKHFEVKLIQTCIEALKKVKSEGLFSSIEESSFVLNFLNGDQEEKECLRYAKQLNSILVFKKYKSELKKI